MKKKILAILLCCAMLFSMTACGDEGDNKKKVVQPTLTTLADFSDIKKALTGDYEISDKVMENGFQNFLTEEQVFGTWEEVKDHDEIKEGDIVKVDYTGYLDDKAFDGGAAKDQYLDVKNNTGMDAKTGKSTGSFIDGFTKGLIGKKVGETIKHNVTFPKDYQAENLKGKETTFEFVIKGIYTYKGYTLETIDDAFVKTNFEKTYGFTKVEEVKEYVESNLSYSALTAYIVDNSKYEIDDSYLEHRTDVYLEYYNKMFESYYGMTYEAYVKSTGEDFNKVLSGWKDGIKNSIKYELIYAGIVKENNLELKEKETVDLIMEQLGDKADEKMLTEYYEYWGLGDEEAGKAYVINEAAVRTFLLDKMGFEEVEKKPVEESTEKTTEKTTETTTEK